MRYLCVHCDHRWEIEGDEAPRRCPACMRATGVEPVRESAKKAATKSRTTIWVGLALIGVVLAGSVLWLANRRSVIEGPVPVRPLSVEEVAQVLKREEASASGLESLLAETPALEAFAKRAAGSASDPFAKAAALTQALRARADAQAFVPWSLAEPRPTALLSADGALKALEKDGARREMYPLELAAIEVAALRSLGVVAMLAELTDLPNERAPVDPSGYFGYFVVSVSADEATVNQGKVYDPYGGRTLPADQKVNVIDDVTAIGAALAIRGVYEVAYRADPKLALESSSHALRLASRLPSVRTARGIIVLSGKMLEQGLQELSAAAQLRGDPVRLHNLASARMLSGDAEAASKALNTALEKAPDFAGARATLGAIEMMQGDLDAAFSELRKAETLAPDLSLIQWGFAEYYMRKGDRESALSRGKAALARRPSFDGRLRYAVLLRQAAKFEEMREQAHAMLDLAPEYRKQEVKELIAAVLGPTALDTVEAQPSAEDVGADPALGLKLGGGSKLLGEGASDLKLDAPTGADPLILSGEASKLRLRSSSEKLELKLGK